MDLDNPKTEKPQLIPLALRAIGSEQFYELESETLVGRETECTISLDSAHISRYHAKLVVTGNAAVIEDLRSSNGTYVNGKRINNKTRVSVGDEIKFDDITFRLTSTKSGAADETIVAVAKPITATNNPKVNKIAPVKQSSDLAQYTNNGPNEDKASASVPDEDNTRLLSNDQLNQYASINKNLQKVVDHGSGPRLIAMTAPVRGKVFKLNPHNNSYQWSIGRSKSAEVCLPDKSVSRQHAMIEKVDGKFKIHSKPDSSAVLLNGESQQDAILKHNDHVQIGHAEFVFRLDEQQNIADSRKIEPSVETSNTPKIIALGVVGMILLFGIAFILLSNS
ncbi:MAG: pSer/pThr/pTyr-binding forkhead associated (FHA) protein [Flavobacteriales bacterium]